MCFMDEAERIRSSGNPVPRARPLATCVATGHVSDVGEVIRGLRDFGDDALRMAYETEVPLRQIQVANAYYREFPEESIAAWRWPIARWKSWPRSIRSSSSTEFSSDRESSANASRRPRSVTR